MSVLSSRTSGGIVRAAVATGGSGYTAPPSITVSGGGGTGATVVAVMAGTRVAELLIRSQGTGFTTAPTLAFSGGGGTGAAGTAYVQSGQKYLTFFRGRNGDVYGVDGMGRGIRWDGAAASAQPIGVAQPAVGPTITQSSTVRYEVEDVQIVNSGAGYNNAPTVVFTGGTPSRAARARAEISDGRLTGVIVEDPGVGYQETPSVSLASGIGSGATFSVGLVGGVSRVRVVASNNEDEVAGVYVSSGGSKYLSTPTVSLTGGGGTGASAVAVTHKVVGGLGIVAGGSGYTTAPTLAFSGGGGTGAAGTCSLTGSAVGAVYVASPGSGYTSAPAIFLSGGGGTGATVAATMETRVSHVNLVNGGYGYTSDPSVTFSGGSPSSTAAATAARGTSVAATQALQWGVTNGLTGQNARLILTSGGKIDGVVVASGGTGCTEPGVTVHLKGDTARRLFEVDQFFAVASVNPAGEENVLGWPSEGPPPEEAGGGYMTPPIISIIPDKDDFFGGGAALTCSVDTKGRLTGVTVLAGGAYSKPPTAVILNTSSRASATIRPVLRGKYRCAFRYLDSTPSSRGGPIPSSISDLTEVDIPAGSGSITWTVNTTHADARATHVELWRTTADQSVVLFRVATLPLAGLSPYVDSTSDTQLTDVSRADYGLLPITLPSGQVNARRFAVPPGEFQVACMFQDRAWYGVDSTGERPNSVMFSEIDEPESVPVDNELVIQENTGEPDKLAAMVPLGPSLLLVQTAHLYRLSYVAQPVIDAAIVLGAYRGVLNSRCWCVLGGEAFLVDSFGMYSYDGQSETAVSVPIDNFWRDGLIDFASSSTFHVEADTGARVVRFFYRQAGDTGSTPRRALCYCISTKAWWEETFPFPVTAGCYVDASGKQVPLYGSGSGAILKPSGSTDSGTAIPYSYRTAELPLTNDDGSRSITFLYKPTVNDSSLSLQLAYNNSASPRSNAVSSDRGSGFVAEAGGGASLNMKLTRSALGDASGVARASYSGRNPGVQSAGGDRHMAAIVAGTASEPVVLRSIAIEGAG